MKALGLIETMGMVGAIEACDAACKTSDVQIYNKHLVTGGIVTVEFVGDIGSVNAAMEAAIATTKKMGVYMGSTVMARPDSEIFKMLDRTSDNLNKGNETIEKITIEKAIETITEEIIEKPIEMAIEETIEKLKEQVTGEMMIKNQKTSFTKKALKNKK